MFWRKTLLLWMALAALIAGYALLAAGDITAAPLLLVIGYCVLLPLFLWRSFRHRTGE
jgi:membrane protein implicated in regulation of membrane protease activity